MESKKIYRDEDLNLAKLAKQMDLSEHQLSEFLNQTYRKKLFPLYQPLPDRRGKRNLCKKSLQKIS